MKEKTILTVLLCCSCTFYMHRENDEISKDYEIIASNPWSASFEADKRFQDDFKQFLIDKNEQEKKKIEQKKQEEEEEKRDELRRRQLENEFNKDLRDGKCSKAKWNKYEFGNYYKKLSRQYNINPYEIIWGDAYTTRNINYLTKLNILENSISYIRHFSEAEIYMYTKNEDKYEKQKIFNKIVEKDNNCYLKLK
ncbi:MAG: hypothetical protein NC218_10115 [Acetobacter sp.]|nr:hypothetical protein [Acetobacter sp.]